MEDAALFDEAQVARARSYHRPLYHAAVFGSALNLALLALAAFGPLGGWLLEPLTGFGWWAQALGLAVLLDAFGLAVGLPLSVWAGFLHERAWGFSTQRLRDFAADKAKASALGLALSGLALSGLVASARLAPHLWPLISGTAAAALVLGFGFLAPLLVEPLFNRFLPLPDTALAARLRALAERAGVPVEEVLVADASRRTRKANAYVSGLAGTRRLVLYDTLLRSASAAELDLVLAHELGHRRAGHLRTGALLGVVAGVCFVGLLWVLLRWHALRLAIGAPAGAASPHVIPFVLLVAAALQLAGGPFGSALSRRWERSADRFSLELTGDLAAFESTHRSLALANLSDLAPPRTVYLAFFSHPTAVERIEAARRIARTLERDSG